MANTDDLKTSLENQKKAQSFIEKQIDEASDVFNSWASLGTIVSAVIDKTKETFSELKNINAYLTEIEKINTSLSKAEVKEIGSNSLNIAGKYGKTSTDYLSALKDMYNAGYKNADSMAELSTAAQSAGNITSELASQYIIATDEAYKMNGSIEALTKTLDGANSIADSNAINMTDLAGAMSVVSSSAAASKTDVDEATAAIGTILSVTNQEGIEAGNAFMSILMNLQQITGEVNGEKIDTASLEKYKKACEELGVSLSEVKDGATLLKSPMEIIKELSEAYNSLDKSDVKRTNLLNSTGSDYTAQALNALLENYSLYEKMLQDYSNGTGTMAENAEIMAQSWEGSMNRLSDTWTSVINNIADSDAIVGGINILNKLLEIVDKVSGAVGSLGTIGIGAGLFAGIQNIGISYECM